MRVKVRCCGRRSSSRPGYSFDHRFPDHQNPTQLWTAAPKSRLANTAWRTTRLRVALWREVAILYEALQLPNRPTVHRTTASVPRIIVHIRYFPLIIVLTMSYCVCMLIGCYALCMCLLNVKY